MWNFDSQASWNALGDGSYVINSIQLALPINIHAGYDEFMQNYIDQDFWVSYKGNVQYWNGDQYYWANGWAGGIAINGFEVKRMAWICD